MHVGQGIGPFSKCSARSGNAGKPIGICTNTAFNWATNLFGKCLGTQQALCCHPGASACPYRMSSALPCCINIWQLSDPVAPVDSTLTTGDSCAPPSASFPRELVRRTGHPTTNVAGCASHCLFLFEGPSANITTKATMCHLYPLMVGGCNESINCVKPYQLFSDKVAKPVIQFCPIRHQCELVWNSGVYHNEKGDWR